MIIKHDEDKLAMFKNKANFINDISMAFIKNPRHHTINKVAYELWAAPNPDTDRLSYCEWLVIEFKGGAILPWIVSGNSELAILEVLANNMFGGHYDQVMTYENMRKASDYSLVDL